MSPKQHITDTEAKSGRTILDGYRKVQDTVGSVAGIAVITDYIGFPDRNDFEVVIRNSVPIIRIFDYDPMKHKFEIVQ